MCSNIFDINPDKIYVYLRVSTKAQINITNGLSEQNEICTGYIEKYFKHTSTEYYTEIGSSYNNKNKLTTLNKIMKNMTSNSLLIVKDISRLGRNTFQVFTLLKKINKTNSHIIGISENLCYNYSRLMDREFSHAIIDSEKSSDYKHTKAHIHINRIKANGGFLGRPPYGTMIIKINNIPYIYKNPNELKMIKLMKAKYRKLKNLIDVTNYLNSINLYNRKNIPWSVFTIKNILKKHYPNILLKPFSNVSSNIFSNIPDLPKNNEQSDLETFGIEKINL